MFSALMFPMDKNPRDNVIVSAFPERKISKTIQYYLKGKMTQKKQNKQRNKPGPSCSKAG